MAKVFTVILALFIVSSGCKKHPAPEVIDPWTYLLDKDLTHWEKFIGVPHYSITTLPGVPKGDGMEGTPLGLNNDPLNVFKIEEDNNNTILHISGEIYGGLTTKKEYGDYHFITEFKWGEKKYEPRLNQVRDNGILYHAYGEHGQFWNVWMNSQEFQVQEKDIGDYYALGPASDIRAVDTFADNQQAWMYSPTNPLHPFDPSNSRCRRRVDAEKPHGEWNTLELICLKGKCIHVVNGKVVMVLENSRRRDANSNDIPLEIGKIQIQSEGAEAFYRNMRIKPITEIPEVYSE